MPLASRLTGPTGRRWLVLALLCLAVGFAGFGGLRGLRGLKLRRGPGDRANPGEPARAFYYWRTQWSAAPALTAALTDLGAARLYVRLFDVDWDEAAGAQPVSALQRSAPLPAGVQIVPVVFLANRVFHRTPSVEPLADRVVTKILRMVEAAGVTPAEVQLDCDWSDGTRARYFAFLTRARAALAARRIPLSATIRLHQIKYAARTGVPPVDRGMLMFYNFGPLRADAARSSIFNAADAERYSSHIAGYALPLDLALPVFSWAVHSRDGVIHGLLEKLDADDIPAADLRPLPPDDGPPRYRAERSFFFRGRYFMEGDQLLLEATPPEVTLQAARIAARGAAGKPFGTVAFFDLDERNLRRHGPRHLQEALAALR